MSTSPFIQHHSAAIRIWHWITFPVILCSLITVLFASTFYDPHDNTQLVINRLQQKNVTVDRQQAIGVAFAFEDKMWDLHKIAGITLALLLLSRIVIEFFESKEETLRMKIRSALPLYKKDKEQRHYLLVKISYSLFYLLLLYMGITGLLLAFGRDLGLSRGTSHVVRQFHALGQYFIYTFLVFHLGGVILADLTQSKGLVSGMIHGNDK